MSIITELQGYEYFTDENTGKTIAVERATGECSSTVWVRLPIGSISYTPEQQRLYKERKEREQQEYIKSKRIGKKSAYTFVSVSEEFDSVSAANITRLIYLSTYLSYDNNELRVSERRVLTRNELSAVLGVSESTAERFWKEVSPKYVSENGSGKLKLNQDIFVRGKMKGLMSFYIKVFAKGMRDLYNSVPKSKHKALGYIFAMLPYINIEHNILCHNTDETDIDNIEPMSMQEFCREIGYDYRHVDRLHNVFKSLTFDVGNGKQELFCSIIKNECTGKQLMIVNPKVFYSGNNAKAVSEFGVFYR
ncbi:MAG: hypothetical protein ACI4HO_02945 [Ruminococcus sp.]